MENPRFVLMPSLEQIALRRVAVTLYSDPRILASIATFGFKPNQSCQNVWDETHTIRDKRSNKDWRLDLEGAVSALQLPGSLRMQMATAVRAVGSEIFTWKLIHGKYVSTSSSRKLACLRKLCWTRAGAVDYRRTAEGLVCDVLDIEKSFELACLYCLEDYIPLLWEELPDEIKRTFCDEEITPHLQLLLPCILEKQSEIEGTITSSRNSFEKAALCGNRTLAEFCFRNLTKEEREASLVRTAMNVISCRNNEFYNFDYRREKLSDVLFYLLSLMNPEERVGIFREMPCNVLRCFLDWPLQDLFLDMADDMWIFFTESEYNNLVRAIYISIFGSGYYFPTILQNLFQRSPSEFRKCFANNEIRNGLCFRKLLMNKDMETTRVILRNFDSVDRQKLVFSRWSFDVISQPVIEWCMVEAFLRAAALSRADKHELKKAFLQTRERFPQAREKLERFFEFVEES